MSLKIVSLMAENVKKLKAVFIEPRGNVVKITGANEQGKTTVLDCIWWALAGSKNIQSQPIRSGESKAKIEIDLDRFKVIRKFTPSGSTVEVLSKEGAVFKSPQAMLDGLIGSLSFDPLKFSRSKKDEQVNILLSVVKFDHDHEKLEKIAGVPIQSHQSPIDDINCAYKTVFAQRTDVNRDVDRVKKQLEAYSGVTEVVRVVTNELVAERDRLHAVNDKNEEVRGRSSVFVDHIQSVTQKITQSTQTVEHLENQIKEIQKQIEAEKDKQVVFNRTLADLQTSFESHNIEVSKLKDEDLSEINTKIANADETNHKASKWEEKIKLETELQGHELKSKLRSDTLDEIKKYKENLISSTVFPVPGLGFSSDGVTLDGIPFEQCSSAQRLRASVAIAMAMNPELRVIRIDDGSLLDSKSMEIIEEIANKNDYQIWMECVDESGSVGVYIEDGEIKSS